VLRDAATPVVVVSEVCSEGVLEQFLDYQEKPPALMLVVPSTRIPKGVWKRS